MGSHSTNFSADASEHGLILNTRVTIGYDAPWRKVHELLINAALATDLIEKDPAPFVFQDSLNDFYVCYQINAYTHVPNRQHIIYSKLHENIQDFFNDAGVEIMSFHTIVISAMGIKQRFRKKIYRRIMWHRLSG